MGERVDFLVRRLREDGEATLAQLAALPERAWAAPIYDAEGHAWQARDVLAHLVTAEQGHQRLIADVAAGGDGALPGFDINAFNDAQVARLAGRPVADLLGDLRAVRAATIAIVSALSDDDLARRGQHPALGPGTTLEDFIKIVTMHVKLHLRDVRCALPA